MRFFFIILTLYILQFSSIAQDLPDLVFSGGKNFVGKDVMQLEYGINLERQQNYLSHQNQQVSQYALLKYGVKRFLDFSISYNYTREQLFVSDQMRRSNGLSNLTIGIKNKLGDNYSLKSNIGFANTESEEFLGDIQILAISEHSIDSFLAWENHLGLNWLSGQPQANLRYFSGLTFTIPYPLDIIVEFYGQFGNELWNNYGNIGLGYYFNTDLMLEAYTGFGNTLDQESMFFSINFYWRLVPARYYDQ